MKYVVIDELCSSKKVFDTLEEAKMVAYNYQATLFKETDEGDLILLKDFSEI